MCRHFVYLGPARPLASLLFDPEWSLERQSWQPRHQQEGALVNADGWGVGWWDHEVRPEPARYRTASPIWADQAFRSTSSLVSASAIFAAVRAATPPLPVVETGNAPFAAGPWLFSLNGFVAGFAGPPGEQLRRKISIERVTGLEGHTDSEVLFGLVLDRLDAGLSPADALAAVVSTARAEAPGRLNLLLSDGHRAAATTVGSSLHFLQDVGLAAGGMLVASEPLDDDPAWERIPDLQVVTIDRAGVSTQDLDLPGAGP